MIQVLSSFETSNSKSRVTNHQNSSNYMSRQSILNQSADTFTKSKKKSDVSFAGRVDSIPSDSYFGYEADRDALAYRIKLTPEEIKSGVYSESTFNTHFAKLCKETQQVGKALQSSVNIHNELRGIAVDRIKQVAKLNPSYSRIPIFGLVKKIVDNADGDFKCELKSELSNVDSGINRVLRAYWDNGMNPIYTAYIQASDALKEKIYYAHDFTKANESIDAGQRKIITNYKNIFNKAIKPLSYLVDNNKSKILEKQSERQIKNIGIRSAVTVLTLGCGFGIGELLGVAGDFLGDAATGTVADALLDSSVDQLVNVGLDEIGNTAKELSHGKSANIAQLTEKSVVNVLRRIR